MSLLNPANPAIATARDEVIRQLMDTGSPNYHKRIETAQRAMEDLMRTERNAKRHMGKEVKCRRCNGYGMVWADTGWHRGQATGFHGHCWACDGAGRVRRVTPELIGEVIRKSSHA